MSENRTSIDLMHPEVQKYADDMVKAAFEIWAVNHPRTTEEHYEQNKIRHTMFPSTL